MLRLLPLGALLVLVAGCAPGGAASPPAAAPLPSGGGAPPPVEQLREDAARLLRPTNAARLAALVELLEERGIPHVVQPVPNTGRPGDPRPEGANVVVTLGDGGRDLVVGAHFDAVQLPGAGLSQGMVDNAAGVAVLLRLAGTLRDRTFRHRVRIVFFDLEEVGLVGSRAYVDAGMAGDAAAMVNLDIAAYGNTVIYGPTDAPGNGAVHGALPHVCAAVRATCLDFPRFPSSDDRSFQAAGIPNVSLAVVPRVDAHQFWLLLNGGGDSGLREGFAPPFVGTVHTERDRAELLDPAAMAMAHDVVLALLLHLDASLP